MKTGNLYIGVISVVKDISYTSTKKNDTITTHFSDPLKFAILLKKNNKYIDINDKNYYSTFNNRLDIGDMFVNLKYPLIPLNNYIIKEDISKRKVKPLIKVLNKKSKKLNNK